MKIPQKVKILGITYDVQEVEVVDKNESLWGKIDYQEQVIKIDSELKNERKAQVLLHEILHGVLSELGFYEINNNEEAVQGLSTALYCTLVDCQDFFFDGV